MRPVSVYVRHPQLRGPIVRSAAPVAGRRRESRSRLAIAHSPLEGERDRHTFIVWHKTDLGPRFWLSDNLVGTDYTSVFSAQSPSSAQVADPHRIAHTYNHAFYFLRGTCSVQIGEQTWHIKPGTLVNAE
jgi:mannose-6-phosphate isomerase-like protein (cupin superfamily)